MQQNEMMLKRIQKNSVYFDDIYSNRDKYKSEWAFEDAQNKLDKFVQKLKGSGCCSKEGNKRIAKKMKHNMLIGGVFKNLQLLITGLETIISVVFVLLISEISHSVDLMIESSMLSFYFLGIFALIKVLFENNIIRPAFTRLSWWIYKYSYQTLHTIVSENMDKVIDVQTVDVSNEFGLAISAG